MQNRQNGSDDSTSSVDSLQSRTDTANGHRYFAAELPLTLRVHTRRFAPEIKPGDRVRVVAPDGTPVDGDLYYWTNGNRGLVLGHAMYTCEHGLHIDKGGRRCMNADGWKRLGRVSDLHRSL